MDGSNTPRRSGPRSVDVKVLNAKEFPKVFPNTLTKYETVFLVALHGVLTGKANREPAAALADARLIANMAFAELSK